MAVKTISRRKLAGFLQQVADRELSGAAMIQTDTSRAIVLRFSAGKLVKVNARGNTVGDAIQVLQQSSEYKFSFSSIKVDDAPELMQVREFIEQIGQGVNIASNKTKIPGSLSVSGPESDGDSTDYNRDILRNMLIQLVVGEIGPIASIVVDQALESGETLERIVSLIADQIPDHDTAIKFTELALDGAKDAL